MSDRDDIGPEDEADLAAAEHVLGLLDAEARAGAVARLRTDPAFAAAVAAWERRFAPLIEDVSPAAPPDRLWDRIATAIAPGAKVVAFPSKPRFWDRVGPWRAMTIGSLAAAAACLAIVVVRPGAAPAPPLPAPPPAGGELLAATLSTPDGKAIYVATLDRDRRTMAVIPVATTDRGGRSPELWVIGAGGKPRAIGMLAATGAGRLHLGRAALLEAGAKAVLAVSLEPAGGSPTGAPTGPVIATGPLVKL
jgi:anti-sigma-K factor RskA